MLKIYKLWNKRIECWWSSGRGAEWYSKGRLVGATKTSYLYSDKKDYEIVTFELVEYEREPL